MSVGVAAASLSACSSEGVMGSIVQTPIDSGFGDVHPQGKMPLDASPDVLDSGADASDVGLDALDSTADVGKD